jgi:lipopolysaccharide export system permease protein
MIGFTLGRYLLLRFLFTILAVFGTVFVLIYLVDFLEMMRRAGDTPGGTTALVAKLSLYRTPSVAEQVFPFAVLFGSMAALLQLSRKLELVVARAAGISAWQFLQPGLLLALVLGTASIAVYNPLSAALKQQAADLESTLFARNLQAVANKEVWLRQRSVDGQAVIRAEAAVEGTTGLAQATIFTFDDSGVFQERIEAREAVLHEGFWVLTDVRVISSGVQPQTYATYHLASNLDPSQVRQTFTPAQSVPFWDLPAKIDQTERAGLDATRYRLHLEALTARPLLFIAMVFVAASVSLRFFRFGGVSRMVLGGVAAGFLLYVANKVMEDLGAAGLVGPAVAAWFPAVVGSLLGTLALLYQEDG